MKTTIERLIIAARNVVGVWDAMDGAPGEDDGGMSTDHYRKSMELAMNELRATIEAITVVSTTVEDEKK